jgi:CRP/FNR family transcriptional regulator, nitrogen fixation regulation protein
MSRLHSLLLILGRTTAEQKVGSFLLNIKERVGNGVADRLRLPVTRYDIADYLALSVETVSRSLTGLKERGVMRSRAREKFASSIVTPSQTSATPMRCWRGRRR